ncbi:MAG: hypothetical protein JNL93_09730 [Pelomonas sp.]|nr:hypothetical protein [Roseateles sp.]
MQFYTQRIDDHASFAALQAPPSPQPVTCFGMRVLKLAYDAMPDAYADDLLLRVPELTDTPHEYFFAASSGGKDLFAVIVLTAVGGYRGAIAVQVSHFALFMPPTGLLAPSGALVEMSPRAAVLMPDDGMPVRHQIVDPQGQQYFAVREGFSHTPLPPAQPASHGQPSAVQQVDRHLANVLTPAYPVSGAPIWVEIGSTAFGRVHANLNPGLAHLAGIDGGMQ